MSLRGTKQSKIKQMKNLISINFGIPEHGWLPVNFKYNAFDLNFDVSDALNNPLEELNYVVTKLKDNEQQRITWWLEPVAYFFDIKVKEGNYILNIIRTNDLHNEKGEQEVLITITGNEENIIEPFRIALRQFFTITYEEIHWAYKY